MKVTDTISYEDSYTGHSPKVSFLDKMTKLVIDSDILKKSLDKTTNLPKRWHDEDVFALYLSDNIYLMYRAVRSVSIPTVNMDEPQMKEYLVNDSKFIYIKDDFSFELITEIVEDKKHQNPHEFMLRVKAIFEEIVENKTYLLHFQSKYSTVQKFCKWCIRKKREENE